jgi:hypothetical protein
MSDKSEYQEAAELFRHCSTLRRTTMGFVFTASGASLGLLGKEAFGPSVMGVLLSVVNLLLVVAAWLQDKHLAAYTRLLRPVLEAWETDASKGPFRATHELSKRKISTSLTVIGVSAVLLVGWALILVHAAGWVG